MTDRRPVAGTVRPLIILPADPAEMRIGGIASFVRSFVKFAPQDFDISMIGISPDLPAWRWATVQMEGRSVRFLPALRASTARRSRIPLAWRFTFSLVRHGHLEGLDDSILQFHRPATDLPFRHAGRARLRFMHLTTDDLTQRGSESRWRSLGAILERLEHQTMRHMDRTYVVNAAAAHAYRARWPDVADRIMFLPNFYDDTIFGPLAEATRQGLREAIIHEHGLERDVRILLSAGRLEGQKDPDLLIDGFAEVRTSDASAVLLVTGDGALRARAEARADALSLGPAVRFLSTLSRERLNELMNVAAVLVISSKFETGPTIGYEALAAGLPVVTTPVGEVARIVAETGAGAVAPDHRPSSLASALRDVLQRSPAELFTRATAAADPFAASAVLEPLYALHRSGVSS